MKTTSWYLKKSDGNVYGPVRLADLKNWVKDSRVAPDDQLSPDQKQWMPAPELAALEMNCLVRYRNGVQYGPVHVRALCELIVDGDVPLDEPVLDKTTDKTLPACLVALRGLMAEETVATPTPATPAGEDVARLRAEHQTALDAAHAKLLAELKNRKGLESEIQRLDALRHELEEKVQALTVQLGQSKGDSGADLKKVADKVAVLARARDDAEKRAADLEKKVKSLEKQLADHAADTGAAASAVDAKVEERVAGLKKQLDDERERNRKREASLQQRSAQFEGDLKSKMEDMIRAKQDAQASRQAALVDASGQGNNPVIRAALAQVRARALARGTNIHAPRSPAQRAAMPGRAASGPAPRPPKRRPAAGGRSSSK